MAKTIKQLENGIRIKYLVKAKRYFLFWGSRQCMINNEYQRGFSSEVYAEIAGNKLQGTDYRKCHLK